jgi:spermidine synthase
MRARLHTAEFYGELARAMTPRAVLCMTAHAAPGSLSRRSAEYLASIRATLQRHFKHVVFGWGDPAHILAATDRDLISTVPAELAARYSGYGIESRWFDPAWFEGATDWLSLDKLRQRSHELNAVPDPIVSTDLRPLIYMQRLALWEAATSAAGAGSQRRSEFSGARDRGVIQWLLSVDWAQFLLALLAIVVPMALLSYVWNRRRASGSDGVSGQSSSWFSTNAIGVSIGSTGFATMALSIIWLFAFQNLYGYVYQRVGWIIALFMGGLVIGCALGNMASRRKVARESGSQTISMSPADISAPLWRWLVIVDCLLAVLALAVPLLLPILATMQTSRSAFTLVELCVSIMVGFTGVLGGAAFGLAGRLQLQATGLSGSAAGTIVGADHAGACLGALLSGILLVPVFGTAVAAYVLAGIKFTSATFLFAAMRIRRCHSDWENVNASD